MSQLKDFSIGPLVGMLISMVTVPITTRLLLPTEFGKSSLFTLTETVFLLLALLGLDQAFVRFFKENTEKRTNFLFHAVFPPLAICLLSVMAIALEGRGISEALFGSYEPLILLLLCLYLPVLVLNRFAILILRMELRGKAYSFVNIFSKGLYFIALLLFLALYQKTFRSIILATMLSTYLITIIAVVLTRSYWTVKKVRYDPVLMKTMILYSLPLIPASILTWLFNSFDKVALRALSTFEELGLYAAGFKIVALLNIISSIFNTTWVPIAYDWHSKKVSHGEYEKVSTYILAGLSSLFSVIVLFREVILLILGPNYKNTEPVLVFLLFIPIMQTVSETTTMGIVFSKKTYYNLLVSVITSVINLLGNYALIPSLGAKGAALTTCVSYIIFFWLRTLISRRLWYPFGLIKYFVVIGIMLLFPVCLVLHFPKYVEVGVFFALAIVNVYFVIDIRRKTSLDN